MTGTRPSTNSFNDNVRPLILFTAIAMAVSAVNRPASQAHIQVYLDRPYQVASQVGILGGLKPETPRGRVAQIAPRTWRVNREAAATVADQGGDRELLCSDYWGYPITHDKPHGAPYLDWNGWESHIRDIAKRYGANVMYDVWNEPDSKEFWWGTREQFFETYARAYRVLREELGPNAMIGGPSLSHFDQGFITDFLDYAVANNLQVNFVSWHELDTDQNVPSIQTRLSQVRSLTQSSQYAPLQVKEVQINEFLGHNGQASPGLVLGYLYYLEKGQADRASKSCWKDDETGSPTCFDGSLGGLLRPGTFEPRPAFWAFKWYADGKARRVQTKTDDPFTVAIAARETTNVPTKILIASLPKGRETSSDSAEVTIEGLSHEPSLRGVSHVDATIRVLPKGANPLVHPKAARVEDLEVERDRVTVNLNSLQPGWAYEIRLTPSE